MAVEGKLLKDEEGALFSPPEGSTEAPAPPAPVPAMDEYFNDGCYSDVTVSIGYCECVKWCCNMSNKHRKCLKFCCYCKSEANFQVV